MNVNEKKKKKGILYGSENGAFALTMNTSLNPSVNSPRNLYVSKSYTFSFKKYFSLEILTSTIRVLQITFIKRFFRFKTNYFAYQAIGKSAIIFLATNPLIAWLR